MHFCSHGHTTLSVAADLHALLGACVWVPATPQSTPPGTSRLQ